MEANRFGCYNFVSCCTCSLTLPKAPGVDFFCIFLRKSVNLQSFDQLYDNVYVW